MPEPITPDQLAAIPPEHRRTIARWLAERADSFRPSWVVDPVVTDLICQAFLGVAVDLADPLSEDTTAGHAAQVIATLSMPAADIPEPAWHQGCKGCWRTVWH